MNFTATKYEGLELSAEFARLATEAPEKIVACCNGVGSERGFWGRLTYHLTPNTIWFLDITPVSDIHDVDCTYPSHFKNQAEALAHLDAANKRFLKNLITYIEMNTSSSVMRYLRLDRAMKYYSALEIAGEESFMEGKTFDE
jgi:hypothetical protein